MTRVFLLLLPLLTGMMPAIAQPSTPSPGVTFLPGKLLFCPAAANYQEPRVGVRKEVGSSRLKLDIGSSIDLLGYRSDSADADLRLGIDFFTYALTTSSEGHRLQVDAVDGYFGGHVAFVSGTERRRPGLRLRILHQSGHLIDGHWDSGTGQWKDGKEPIPYTRNSVEVTGSCTWSGEALAFTAYAGVGYSILVRPEDLAPWATLQGVELRTTGLVGPVFGKPFILYAADHLAVSGIPTYYGSNNLEWGAKFGPWEGTGIKLYASWYSGLDVFSQYYFVRRNGWGVGIAFDFW
jgi:hypothetical protein